MSETVALVRLSIVTSRFFLVRMGLLAAVVIATSLVFGMVFADDDAAV